MTNSTRLSIGIIAGLLLFSNNLLAGDTIRINKQAVDHASLVTNRISKLSPIHVRLFDADHADLGKPKHRDTAELLARAAPHLLAVDIVESLRDSAFENVMLDESDVETSGVLTLTGSFTRLDPGSQAARAWIGFGAGESKVCVEGRLSDETGTELGSFSHCKKGLGWGKSDSQMESSAVRVGDSIALFLTEWANGDYAR